MTVEYIKKVTENKLASLRNDQSNAVLAGDLALVASLDILINETETTLAKLNTIE